MVAIQREKHATRYRLTQAEIRDLIDREARKSLNISGAEFLRRRGEGDLPETVAKRDIEMLVQLLGPRWHTTKSSSRTSTR